MCGHKRSGRLRYIGWLSKEVRTTSGIIASTESRAVRLFPFACKKRGEPVDGLAIPLVVENTGGVKVECSTSSICCS